MKRMRTRIRSIVSCQQQLDNPFNMQTELHRRCNICTNTTSMITKCWCGDVVPEFVNSVLGQVTSSQVCALPEYSVCSHCSQKWL